MVHLTLRRLTAAIAVAVGLVAAGPARADIVIDTFTDPSVTVYQIAQFNSSPYSTGGIALSNGLTRNLTVTVASPAVPDFNAASGTIGAGSFSMDVNNNTVAFASIDYSGFGAGTNDFSAGTSIRLDFINLNPGNTATGVAPDLPMTVTISTGSGTLTQTINVAGSGAPFSVDLPFAGFSGTGDLSSIGGLNITLNAADGRIASDFVLDNVVVPTNAVPAPPALALLLAAAPVLVLRRRMAKKTA
jgi:hypothetical protein